MYVNRLLYYFPIFYLCYFDICGHIYIVLNNIYFEFVIFIDNCS